MNYYDQSVILLVFFPVFTTITVGVRIFVRTRLCKGAFGWDDVLLIITNVSSSSCCLQALSPTGQPEGARVFMDSVLIHRNALTLIRSKGRPGSLRCPGLGSAECWIWHREIRHGTC